MRWFQAGIFGVLMLLGGYASPTSANNHVRFSPIEITSAAPKGYIDGTYGLTPATAILEIRRISAATWEELGELFDVSPRSLHFWANGKPLSAQNERLVYQMLSAFRSINTGSVSEVRAVLFGVSADGMSLFEHLKAQNFDHALLTQRSNEPALRNFRPLNASAAKSRAPISVGAALSGDDSVIAVRETFVRKSLRRAE